MSDTRNHPGVDHPARDELLFDTLLCVADSKFILGNWYLIALPNGRAVPDWSALCAMLQGQYGHARALYRYLSRFGFTREETEWQRDAASIRSARVLDTPPASWTDFVVTAYLAELAFSQRLAALVNEHTDPQLARLVQKILQESGFHQLYLSGWVQVMVTGQPGEVQEVLQRRLATLGEWWGPASEAQRPDHLVELGLSAASDAALRLRFLESIAGTFAALERPAIADAAGSTAATWHPKLRRSGRPGIPDRLHALIRFKEPELAVP